MPARITTDKELASLLDRYGYYKVGPKPRIEPQATSDAIRRFQIVHRLPITGKLDRKTAVLLRTPRCGEPDTALINRIQLGANGVFALAAAAATANYANGQTIRYRIASFSGQLAQDLEREIYAEAFKTWANILSVAFDEVQAGGDFSVEWRATNHFGDAGVLAHANNQHISFNGDYNWSDDRAAGTHDLFSVAAHEVGHVLGFNHTAGSHDIMCASIGATTIRRFVRKDEFDQARAAYELRSNKGSFRNGLTAGDFDGDGADEIALLRNSDGNVYVFRFDKQNALIEEASNWHPGSASRWIAGCAADLTATGQDALVCVRDYDSGFYAWQSTNGNFSMVASNTAAGPNSAWLTAVAGDFDGDKKDEVVAVRDYDDGFYMYRYDGTNQLKSVAANTAAGDKSRWIDMASGDFDGDGKDEFIAVRDYDDGFYMYRYDGTNKLKCVASNADPGDKSQWIVLGAGDIDGDHRDEVIGIRDYDDGFYVYKYDGTSKLKSFAYNDKPGDNSAWRDMAVGDFDGDGVDGAVGDRVGQGEQGGAVDRQGAGGGEGGDPGKRAVHGCGWFRECG